jgi:putative ABC transport system permease protein
MKHSPKPPPKWALKLLHWLHPEDTLEEVEGDLAELYAYWYGHSGKRKADFRYALAVLSVLPPLVRRRQPNKFYSRSITLQPDMLRNYFTVACRNLIRHKVYSFINIAGLSVGMTCFMLIALFIQYEMSYDTQHEKAGRIYRVAQRQKGNIFRGTDRFAVTPSILAPTLKSEFPEVQAATTLQTEEISLTKEEHTYDERGLFADEAVFDVFTFTLLAGAGKEALNNPDALILTQSMARKYFAGENPIGKTIYLQDKRPLTVRGIIADIPKNQHLQFSFITYFSNIPYYEGSRDKWDSNNYLTYIVLPEKYPYQHLEQKLVSLDRYLGSYARLPFKPAFFLQPLLSIHLHSQLNVEAGANGDIRYVYLFAAIAFIILLLASINYTNLTIAQYARRTKEVGVRKVIGAQRMQLVGQFLGESFLLTITGFGLALALSHVLLPAFNHLLGQSISVDAISHYGWLAALLAAAVLLSGLSGLYPAVFLSAISPVRALKGRFLKTSRPQTGLRNSLIIGQFAASVILSIGSVVIYRQLQYMQEKELGYSREQIIYIPYTNLDIRDKIPAIRTELLRQPQIEKVSFPVSMPLNMYSETIVNDWEGNPPQADLFIYKNYVDYDFLDLFEMELKEGRNFSPEYPTDSTESYILNESAVKALGWESAQGKKFHGGKVIGVVKDFHFQPLNLAIKPLFLALRNKEYYAGGNIAIKVSTREWERTLAGVEKTLGAIVPKLTFDYRFMDEAYIKLYESEKRLGQTFTVFTALSLFIACLGLFGLVSFQVLQRTKEIGIRKVLGASVSQLVGLLSRDFIILVLFALLVAWPLAWWGMHQWLQNFAYRVEIDGWLFVLVGALVLLIAFLTVSIQTLKASRANPVDSLRNE